MKGWYKPLPWEETDEYIRSGHRNPEDFEEGSLRTITLSEEEGIKAVVGKLKGEDTTTIQSYLFSKEKGWTLDKAKAWFEQHREGLVKEHVSAILPFQVLEKIVDKPLRIRGVAMTAGMSRNFNIYTPEELQAFASKLVNAPVYIEHVSVDSAVGKVEWTDASIGKSLSSGLSCIDVPVTSWGIFIGLLGEKSKHIILGQNNFRYADGLYDIDYTAIPLSWTTNIHVIQEQHVP